MFLVCFPLTRHLLTANRTSTPSVFMKTQQTANIRHKHDNTVFYIHTRSFPRKVWFRFGNASGRRSCSLQIMEKLLSVASAMTVELWPLWAAVSWRSECLSLSLTPVEMHGATIIPGLNEDLNYTNLGLKQQSIVLDNTVPMFFYLRLDSANWAPRTAQIFSICLLTDVKPLYDAIMTYSSIRFCLNNAMFLYQRGNCFMHASMFAVEARFYPCKSSKTFIM